MTTVRDLKAVAHEFSAAEDCKYSVEAMAVAVQSINQNLNYRQQVTKQH